MQTTFTLILSHEETTGLSVFIETLGLSAPGLQSLS